MKRSKLSENIKPDEVSFEEALRFLEAIVKAMETDELPLEESLSKFAEGVKFSQICLAKINMAEQQVDKIVQKMQGQVVEKPFILQEDETC